MEYLSGIVERITYVNEENGFTVAKIKSRGFPDLVTVVGNMAAANVGAAVKLKGEWKVDSRFGRQFSVIDYTETIPATVAGIEKYLGSGLIKGIGPVNAKRIVKAFGVDTIRVIEEEPEKLAQAEGIGRKRVEMITEAWQEQKEIKNVMLFLQSHGVSTSFAVKIYKTYGDNSIKIVQANPYRLADDIWGIGFRTADIIAGKLGFDKNSYERCRSGVLYILNELSKEGHCFATKEELTDQTEKMLELERDNITGTIEKLAAEKLLIPEGEDNVYLPPFYYSEVGAARRIQEITSRESSFSTGDIEKIIGQVQAECGITYDEVQKDAVRTAVKAKFMVLTGGPGTGKTTTTLAVIRAFQKMGAEILLAAPTGRAAKRMTETTGMEAKTIHRLLEFKPPEGCQRNEENPLDCDLLIIDETSMVDIILFYNLLKAVKDDTVVILVGDADQLPSVSAGNVLNDIIDSGAVSVVRLQRIFRQAQGSMIVTNAHRINTGEFPVIKGGKNNDFFFIEEDDPVKAVEIIKDLCSRRLPGYYDTDPVDDIQVLCPMQRGETGAVNLNRTLQDVLNPNPVHIMHGGVQYRVRDKVMQIRNNYDKNVFNGDIGRIVSVDREDRTVEIKFDDSVIQYDVSELDEVIHAYATTIHKSQGSEYRIVVAPFSTQHYMMLQRNLLYTAITRAREVMVIVGSKKALAMAVKNRKIAQRNTLLARRLREHSLI